MRVFRATYKDRNGKQKQAAKWYVEFRDHFEKVRRILGDLGLAEQSRYIERATMASQRILPLDAVDPSDVPYFSMILVHKRGEAWT